MNDGNLTDNGINISPDRQTLNRNFLEQQCASGANWFYWIAALSLINSVIFISGGNLSFIAGLGITQIIEGISGQFGSIAKYIALGFNIMIAGIFAVFGVLANKRLTFAFIMGMLFYLLDGLIFILVKDIAGIIFHGVVLYFIYKGFVAMRKLNKLNQSNPLIS